MTIEQALAILDSADRDGMFYPMTPGLGEACRVVAEGYRAAVSDIELITNVLNCDYTCANKTDACKGYDKDKQCRGYTWRGPEPGGEGSKCE